MPPLAKTTVNLPPALLKCMEQHAAQTGTDATAVMAQALFEFFAGPNIGTVAYAAALESFTHGATCAACGAENVENFTVLMDEPLITVCAPFCPGNSGPVDAHGYALRVGDSVYCCVTPDGPIIARVVGISIDLHTDPVATFVIEGVNRSYRQRCRMLQRVQTEEGKASTRPGRRRQ